MRVTGTPLTLTNRLKQFLGGDALIRLPLVGHDAQPRHRARRELLPDSDTCSESDLSEAETEQPGPEQQELEKNFKFTIEGEMVAVYYVEDFFFGEVTAIASEDEAQVNFMVKADSRHGTSVYKWPSHPDRSTICFTVVFARNLSLVPSSSSGRTFVVESPAGQSDLYKEFKDHLKDNFPL